MQYQHTLSRLATSTLVVELLVAACGAPLTAGQQANDGAAQAQIERRVLEIFAAAENKDFARLESYHLYGPKFTRFSGSSPERLDAAATRHLEHNAMAAIKDLRMRAESLKIDVFGNVGIATFILDYSFDAGGRKFHKRDRSTLVFFNAGEDWRIVHEHLSEIAGAEAGGTADESQPNRSDTKSPSPATGSRR
jgi:ketosteroid isomerase-like protein